MTVKAHLEFLSNHAFFKDLPKKYMELVAKHGKERRFPRGDVVFHQDEPATNFYVIRSGEVSVEIPALYGPPIIVQTLKDNDLVGWSWIIPPYQWHFQARAAEDTDTIEFDGNALRKVCERDPAMGYELLKRFAELMSGRVQAARMRIMEMCAPPETV